MQQDSEKELLYWREETLPVRIASNRLNLATSNRVAVHIVVDGLFDTFERSIGSEVQAQELSQSVQVRIGIFGKSIVA